MWARSGWEKTTCLTVCVQPNDQVLRAACHGDIEGIESAIAAKASVNYQIPASDIDSPLMLAADFNRLEAAQVLIQLGANRDLKDRVTGVHPLRSAAITRGCHRMAKLRSTGLKRRKCDRC